MEFIARSQVEPLDPSMVLDFVPEIELSRYLKFATLTVLVYDNAITLDKEARYFGKSPNTSADFVYFANRYIGLLGAVSSLGIRTMQLILCNFAAWTHNLSSCATVVLIDYILVLRVLALYQKDRKIMLFLASLLVSEAILKISVLIHGTLLQRIVVGGLDADFRVCGYDNYLPLPWPLTDWSSQLGYGVILMVMALHKAAEFWKTSHGVSGFTLVKVLIQDQLLYFLFVVSCCVFNILYYKVNESNLQASAILSLIGSPSFLCILGSRMMVNLKEAGARGQNEGTTFKMKTPSEMIFCQVSSGIRM